MMIVVWYRLPYCFLICFRMCKRSKLKYFRPFRKIIKQIVVYHSFENLLFVYNLLQSLNRLNCSGSLSAYLISLLNGNIMDLVHGWYILRFLASWLDDLAYFKFLTETRSAELAPFQIPPSNVPY